MFGGLASAAHVMSTRTTKNAAMTTKAEEVSWQFLSGGTRRGSDSTNSTRSFSLNCHSWKIHPRFNIQGLLKTCNFSQGLFVFVISSLLFAAFCSMSDDFPNRLGPNLAHAQKIAPPRGGSWKRARKNKTKTRKKRLDSGL